jgi:cytochrome c biogenesis protein CcmG/thiol:disulfide interchange protein DsbE
VTVQKTRAAGRPATKRPGNRWLFPAVIAAVVVAGVIAIAVAAGGGGGDDKDVVARPGDPIEVAAEVTVGGSKLPNYTGTGRDAAIGMTAPTLGGVDFAGANVEAGGATGEPYAVVFLAHWCPHCQAEVPRLVSLGRNGQITGVDVVGVATGTTDERPNYPPSTWLSREGWRFGVLVDDAAYSAAGAYGLTSYPFLVFVDAEGEVAGRIAGEVSESDLRTIFRALADGKALPLPGAGPSSGG